MERGSKPQDYDERILLCVTGLSPQILTETLYALAVKKHFIPTEVHLITTIEGHDQTISTLLSDDPGWFHRLLNDYALPAIRFDVENIHVLTDPAGKKLPDIRTVDDNEIAADVITEQVRQFTQIKNSALHVSIAGGRKTMGFFAAYALSLYGRSQDRLSHVLVSPEYESLANFYYPTPYSHPLNSTSPPLDSKNAEVSLAEIPFVRLRDGLPQTLLEGQARFSEVIAQAQQSFESPSLILDRTTRKISCNHTIVELSPVDFAFYAWFAERARQGKEGICRTDISAEETAEFIAEYQKTVQGDVFSEIERVNKALKNGMDEAYFDSRRSYLKKTFEQKLSRHLLETYHIVSDRQRPRSRYSLKLEPQQIQFAEIESELD